MADDFCSINDANRYKMLRYIWHWFNNWGGRYSAIALDELLVFIGPIGVRYMTIFVLLFWTIVATFTCLIFLRKNVSRDITPAMAASLGVLVIYVLVVTSPGVQTILYWWNGMRTYIPPLILSGFLVSYIYWVLDRPNTHRLVFLVSFFSFSVALFTGGFNETFTTVQVLFFLGMTGILFLTRKIRPADTLFKLLLASLLGSLMALTIMAISPGAARRQIFFPPRPDIITMIEVVVSGYLKYLLAIASSLKKITAMAGMVFAFIWLGSNSERRSVDRLTTWMWMLGFFSLSVVSLIPSVYGLGQMPAPRTFIVPTYILVICLAGGGLILGKWLSTNDGFVKSNRLRTGLLICTIGLILFSTWINTKDIYENRNVYIQYAQLWDDVDASIKLARMNGEESITIPAMGGWAGLDRPNQNPNFWPTACYTEFYDFQVYGPPYFQQDDPFNEENNR